MRTNMPKPLILIGSIVSLGFVLANTSAGKTTTEALDVTVVAHDKIKTTTPCYRGCEGSLIVRIQSRGSCRVQYARVDFRFRKSSSFPRQLIKHKRRWRFRVIRTSSLDEPIYEYLVQERTPYSEEKKYPNWKMVPGAEDEKLPYGETLPSYALVRNKFERIP